MYTLESFDEQKMDIECPTLLESLEKIEAVNVQIKQAEEIKPINLS